MSVSKADLAWPEGIEAEATPRMRLMEAQGSPGGLLMLTGAVVQGCRWGGPMGGGKGKAM